jgi:hypothetical protein
MDVSHLVVHQQYVKGDIAFYLHLWCLMKRELQDHKMVILTITKELIRIWKMYSHLHCNSILLR